MAKGVFFLSSHRLGLQPFNTRHQQVEGLGHNDDKDEANKSIGARAERQPCHRPYSQDNGSRDQAFQPFVSLGISLRSKATSLPL